MKTVGVAILGLGVVGGGTYKILTEHREFYRRTQNVDISVECVLELNRQRALDLGVEESRICSNIAEVVSNPNVDIVVEVIGGVEPARSFVLAALHSGKSVVTSNKELFCKYWFELEKAAKRTNVGLYFEASCVGGVPIIRTLIDGMQANVVNNLTGIINGTTNYILTRMTREGLDYREALKDAQALGYAEKDPTADVEGYDATYKLSILASLAFHTKVPLDKIYREGITDISRQDIAYGEELGYVLKLLAIGKNDGEGNIEVRVHPAFIRKDHPLASVSDSFNAVFLKGDCVGDIMLYGRGAGALPTGRRHLCRNAQRSQVRRVQKHAAGGKGRPLCLRFQEPLLYPLYGQGPPRRSCQGGRHLCKVQHQHHRPHPEGRGHGKYPYHSHHARNGRTLRPPRSRKDRRAGRRCGSQRRDQGR